MPTVEIFDYKKGGILRLVLVRLVDGLHCCTVQPVSIVLLSFLHYIEISFGRGKEIGV